MLTSLAISPSPLGRAGRTLARTTWIAALVLAVAPSAYPCSLPAQQDPSATAPAPRAPNLPAALGGALGASLGFAGGTLYEVISKGCGGYEEDGCGSTTTGFLSALPSALIGAYIGGKLAGGHPRMGLAATLAPVALVAAALPWILMCGDCDADAPAIVVLVPYGAIVGLVSALGR